MCKLIEILNEQRTKGTFCDVIFVIQSGDSVFGHFCVIGAQSEFVGGKHFLHESLQFSIHNPLRIEICKFDCSDCLIKMLDYFYGRDIEITTEHEPHFEQLAKILSVTRLLNDDVEDQISENLLSQELNVNVDVENIFVPKQNFYHCRNKSNQHQSKTNTCAGCDFKCYKPLDMVSHLMNCNSESFICCLCDVGFYSRKNFQEHLSCHLFIDEKPFFCFECDLRFPTKAALNLHTPKHSTEAPYQCPHCFRAFKWKHGLNSHMLGHDTEKKLLCDECGFSTARMKTLRAHKLTHTGAGFRCTFSGCSHISSRKENLKLHIATHRKETPYVCEICGHKFSQSKNLKRHALIHTESKDFYKCPHCPYSTHRSDKLREHIQNQHTEKPIQLELPEKAHNSFDSKTDEECFPSNAENNVIKMKKKRECIKKTISNKKIKGSNFENRCQKLRSILPKLDIFKDNNIQFEVVLQSSDIVLNKQLLFAPDPKATTLKH